MGFWRRRGCHSGEAHDKQYPFPLTLAIMDSPQNSQELNMPSFMRLPQALQGLSWRGDDGMGALPVDDKGNEAVRRKTEAAYRSKRHVINGLVVNPAR